MIISKDQKISEFRQSWIDSLREDISEFIGLCSLYSTSIRTLKEWSEDAKDSELKELEKNALDYLRESNRISVLYNRINLRLNPDDDKEIVKTLSDIEECFLRENHEKLRDRDCFGGLTSGLMTQSQILLKKEWKRVKRGESGYLITKYIFLIFIILCIVLFVAYKGEIKKTLFSKPEIIQNEQPKLPNHKIQVTPKSGAPD